MATPIIMPKFGQMTEESAIVEWLKKEGDKVAKGDILFTVETDKSVMEVESFAKGTLLKIVVPPGVSVPVQSTVGFLGQPGEPIPRPARANPGAKGAGGSLPLALVAPRPSSPLATRQPLAPRPSPLARPSRARLQRLRPCSASARARRHWPPIA